VKGLVVSVKTLQRAPFQWLLSLTFTIPSQILLQLVRELGLVGVEKKKKKKNKKKKKDPHNRYIFFG
jgi:hypothetical protein